MSDGLFNLSGLQFSHLNNRYSNITSWAVRSLWKVPSGEQVPKPGSCHRLIFDVKWLDTLGHGQPVVLVTDDSWPHSVGSGWAAGEGPVSPCPRR